MAIIPSGNIPDEKLRERIDDIAVKYDQLIASKSIPPPGMSPRKSEIRAHLQRSTLESNIIIQTDRISRFIDHIKMPEMVKSEEYIAQVERILSDYEEKLWKITKEADAAISALKFNTGPVEFTSHKLGNCKYQSIGHTKYCYLALYAPMIYTQWIRVFFNKEIILLDKTLDTIPKDREESVFEHSRCDTPPNVWIIHPELMPQLCGYLSDKLVAIHKEAYELPLNAGNVKESTEYCCTILKKETINNQEVLIPIHKSVLGDPHGELWLAIRIRCQGNQNVVGFARKIDLTGDIMKLTRETSPGFNEVARNLHHNLKHDDILLLNWNSNMGSTHDIFKLYGAIENRDLYLQKIFEGMVDKFRATITQEPAGEQP